MFPRVFQVQFEFIARVSVQNHYFWDLLHCVKVTFSHKRQDLDTVFHSRKALSLKDRAEILNAVLNRKEAECGTSSWSAAGLLADCFNSVVQIKFK